MTDMQNSITTEKTITAKSSLTAVSAAGQQTDAGRKIIAICDNEISYSCHLMEYLKNGELQQMDIRVYSSAGKLLSLEEPDNIALLIISESEYAELSKEILFSHILVLNESDRWLGEDIPNISKYQSMENVTKVVFELCLSGEDLQQAAVRHRSPMIHIGVYSPLGRCLNTSFAITMGELLARKTDVLYLNFEPYSGLEQMVGRSFSGNIADLLFYNDCAREKLPGRLLSIREKLGDLDLIPPMKNYTDLQSVTEQQWCSLLESIGTMTDYEYLVMDLSESVSGLMRILRECDEVYTITRSDSISAAKLKAYEDQLQSAGYEDLRMKTKWIELPVFDMLPASFEGMQRGPLADYVKRLRE